VYTTAGAFFFSQFWRAKGRKMRGKGTQVFPSARGKNGRGKEKCGSPSALTSSRGKGKKKGEGGKESE